MFDWLIPVLLFYLAATMAVSIISGVVGGWVFSRINYIVFIWIPDSFATAIIVVMVGTVGVIIPLMVPLWFTGVYLRLSMPDALMALLISYSSFFVVAKWLKSRFQKKYPENIWPS